MFPFLWRYYGVYIYNCDTCSDSQPCFSKYFSNFALLCFDTHFIDLPLINNWCNKLIKRLQSGRKHRFHINIIHNIAHAVQTNNGWLWFLIITANSLNKRNRTMFHRLKQLIFCEDNLQAMPKPMSKGTANYQQYNIGAPVWFTKSWTPKKTKSPAQRTPRKKYKNLPKSENLVRAVFLGCGPKSTSANFLSKIQEKVWDRSPVICTYSFLIWHLKLQLYAQNLLIIMPV